LPGRDRLVKYESCSQGGHDAVVANVKSARAESGHPKDPNQVPASIGMPKSVFRNTLKAPFNDIEALDHVMQKRGDEVGATILEPIPTNMDVHNLSLGSSKQSGT